MSLTTGAVSSLKARLFGAAHRAEGVPPQPPAVGDSESRNEPASGGADEVLLAVGRENEDIRRAHESVLRKASWLVSLEDDLKMAFTRADQTLEDLARARSELAKLEAVGRFDRGARDAAVQRASELTAENEKLRSELELLRPEAARLAVALGLSEQNVLQFEADNAGLGEQLAKARNQIAQQTEAGLYAAQDLEAARVARDEADQTLAKRVAELADSQQRLEIAEQGVRSLAELLEQARLAAARAATDLEDERLTVGEAHGRIASLESALHDARHDHARLRASWQQEADQHRLEVAELKTKLAHETALGAVRERLLLDVQIELQGKAEEHSRAERKLAETQMAADQNAHKAEAAEAARERALGELASAKAQQRTLLGRVKPLVAAIRAKTTEANQKALALAEAEGRLETNKREARGTIEQLESKVAGLIVELESERSRRILAEGALGADRQSRNGGTAGEGAAERPSEGPGGADAPAYDSAARRNRSLLLRPASGAERSKGKSRAAVGGAA